MERDGIAIMTSMRVKIS